MKSRSLFVCMLLMSGSGFVFAQATPPGDGKAPPSPPQEAFTVCKGRQAGEQVTITMGDRSMTATCEVFPGNGQLAARPSGTPPQKPQ